MSQGRLAAGVAVWVIAGLAAVCAAQKQSEPPVKPAEIAPKEPAENPGGEPWLVPTKPLAHVEQRGTGPIPLVLIPGLNCDWTVFEKFMDRNKDRYTMYAITLPGFGKSEPPPGTKDYKAADGEWLNNAEAAVFEMILEHKIESPVVVGHAMGGLLAIRLISRHPDVLRSAVSIDGHPAVPLGGPGQPMPIELRRQIVADSIVPQFSAMPDEQWKQVSGQLGALVKNTERGRELAAMSQSVPREVGQRYLLEQLSADASEQAHSLKKPCLFIIALAQMDSDPSIVAMAREAFTHQYETFEDLTIVYFEDTSHFVMDDAPAELDRAIEQFVEGKPVEGKKHVEQPAAPGPGGDAQRPATSGKEAPKEAK